MDLKIIEKVLDLVLSYGLNNVKESLFSLNKNNITMSDLLNLDQKFKNPESYFDKKITLNNR